MNLTLNNLISHKTQTTNQSDYFFQYEKDCRLVPKISGFLLSSKCILHFVINILLLFR